MRWWWRARGTQWLGLGVLVVLTLTAAAPKAMLPTPTLTGLGIITVPLVHLTPLAAVLIWVAGRERSNGDGEEFTHRRMRLRTLDVISILSLPVLAVIAWWVSGGVELHAAASPTVLSHSVSPSGPTGMALELHEALLVVARSGLVFSACTLLAAALGAVRYAFLPATVLLLAHLLGGYRPGDSAAQPWALLFADPAPHSLIWSGAFAVIAAGGFLLRPAGYRLRSLG